MWVIRDLKVHLVQEDKMVQPARLVLQEIVDSPVLPARMAPLVALELRDLQALQETLVVQEDRKSVA